MRNGSIFLAFCLAGCGILASACSEDSAVQPVAATGGGGGGEDTQLGGGDGQSGSQDGASLADGQVPDPDGVSGDASDGAHDDSGAPDGSTDPDGGSTNPDGGVAPDAAACTPTTEICNGLDDDCDGLTDVGASCNDGKPCTTDKCTGFAGCQHAPAPFATACDLDGNACTQDHCQAGLCVSGVQPQCVDGEPCTIDACDPQTGDCTHTFSTGPCDDGNGCTSGDSCQGGCVPGIAKVCNDGSSCTLDTCDPKTGACVFQPYASGTPCDDGSKCTAGDTCSGSACAGAPVNCADANPCTDDTCTPGQGCQHPALDGIACSDGLPCTTGDTCQGGQCKANGTLGCDDGNPCTIDACANASACSHTPTQAACDDGTLCTQGDTCATGACIGKQVSCDDGNPCTTQTCDAKAGCVYQDNAAPCNDGNACTVSDTCTGGSCVGQPTNCNDGIACTLDLCDAASGGCSHAPNKALCDDGDICTLDACLTASGCKHDLIPKCCGGSQCAADEACIQYPDNLVPFCAKTCSSGADCPGSCCYMTYGQKHCLTPTYQSECCNTSEYWATDADPYACGVGGKGECINMPNPQPPYYPSKIMACENKCSSNADCPGSCCALSTMGAQNCVAQGYQGMFCPGGP